MHAKDFADHPMQPQQNSKAEEMVQWIAAKLSLSLLSLDHGASQANVRVVFVFCSLS
jgi:hypothetical protein